MVKFKETMLKIIRITFYLLLFLFLLDIFNVFQTKIDFFKGLIYYGVFILPIPILILEFKINASFVESFLSKGIPIVTIIGLIYLNPLIIIFNTAVWKTQTVILVNENRTNHKVEFQMKDLGALGYAKRTSEVLYFSKYFYSVLAKKYDDRNFSSHQWKKVNQHINEIGLK